MNVGSACDVNTVLKYFLESDTEHGVERSRQALLACRRLASGANKRLSSGLRAEDLPELFTRTKQMRRAVELERGRGS